MQPVESMSDKALALRAFFLSLMVIHLRPKGTPEYHETSRQLDETLAEVTAR